MSEADIPFKKVDKVNEDDKVYDVKNHVMSKEKLNVIRELKRWKFESDPWSADFRVWSSIKFRYITLDFQTDI